MLETQLDSIKKNFIKYLDSLGLSTKSHKNYRSDLNHFSGWAILKVRAFGSYVETLTEVIPFLSTGLANEYKNYMIENSVSSKTVNRRLSTLRHLAKFMLLSQAIDQNFMDGVENISSRKSPVKTKSPIVEEFKSHLEAQKASPNTIKNYLSDVRQFLSWLESHQSANQTTN